MLYVDAYEIGNASGGDDIQLLKAGGDEAVKILTSMRVLCMEDEWLAEYRFGEKINGCPDIQEKDQEVRWTLSCNFLDRNHGTPESIAEGVRYTRTTDRAIWFQKRKRNEGTYGQRKPARPIHVIH